MLSAGADSNVPFSKEDHGDFVVGWLVNSLRSAD